MLQTTVHHELKAIFRHWLMWFTLGNQDIKLRYRRSSIGPFWITISMAVTVFSMGFLYGHLFKQPLEYYLPYLASGLIGWSLISTFLIESSNIFIESDAYVRNRESFMSLFMMRLVLRNTLVFFHNLIVFVPIIIFFNIPVSFNLLLLIPGIVIIGVNALFWGTLLAIIGTRYRDFAQIVTSLVQVVFFLTPIMWMPSLLPDRYHWVALYNPFNQFLNLIRAPLVDQMISMQGLLIVGVITVIGFLLYATFINKYKHRIVFWL